MGQTKLLFVSYCSVRVQGTSHWSRVSLLSVSLFFSFKFISRLPLLHKCDVYECVFLRDTFKRLQAIASLLLQGV